MPKTKPAPFDASVIEGQLEEVQGLLERHAELIGEAEEIEATLAGMGLGKMKAKRKKRKSRQGQGRTKSPEGLSVADHLIRDILLDSKSEEGTNREEAVEALKKIGVVVGGENPSVGVGQTFSALKKAGLVKTISRGYYVRTAKGDKVHAKLKEAQENASTEEKDKE